ncbi:MAG: alpha/beta fold hydrolase [Myxococcaceae bacterium]|nr:alpha/beta fold hydrolase [Myxococcaceae bacterium]
MITALALVALWGCAVGWIRLRARDPVPLESREVVTSDGWTLRVWRRPAPVRRWKEPVVLAHGLANHHRVFSFPGPESLASALAARGFDCYLVDFRDTVSARPPPGRREATFDDLAECDVPALASAVLAWSGASSLHWVGHSLGGAVAAVAPPQPLAGLVTLGSPLFFGAQRPVVGLLRLGLALTPGARFPLAALAAVLSPLAGWLPWPRRLAVANVQQLRGEVQRWLLACAFAPLWRGVLRQLLDFFTHDVFRSVDRERDLREHLRALAVPCLVVAGEVDALAPPAMARLHYEQLTTPDRTLMVLGRAHGQVDDYGHADLILGLRAPVEVFGPVAAWLEARSTSALGATLPTRGEPATELPLQGT